MAPARPTRTGGAHGDHDVYRGISSYICRGRRLPSIHAGPVDKHFANSEMEYLCLCSRGVCGLFELLKRGSDIFALDHPAGGQQSRSRGACLCMYVSVCVIGILIC